MAKRRSKGRRKSRAKLARPDRRLPVLLVIGAVGLVLAFLGSRPPAPVIGEEPLSASSVVRIEVRNGCGVPGVAAEIRRELIDLGQRSGMEIDVVGTENAEDFAYDETILVDLRRDVRRTGRLARLIGCKSIVKAEDREAYPDYRLIIGKDYGELEWKR